jgi:hypothetical protein
MSKDPVPEWFGKGEAPPAQHRSAEARSSVGCAVPLVLLLVVSGIGAGFFLFMARAPSADVTSKPVVIAEAPEPQPVAVPVPVPPTPAETVPAPAAEEPPVAAPEPAAEGAAPPDRAKILLVIKGSQKRFQACYENALNYAPDAEGTVWVTMVISSTGRVPVASTSQSGTLPPQVASCISAIARTLKFPESSEQIKVTHPFAFKPG